MSLRTEKVNKLLKREVGKIILEETNIPLEIMTTITKVKVSKDLRYADVFVSIFPFEKSEEALELLNENIFYLQKVLNKKLRMKPLPKIRFCIDDSGEYVGKIDKLIEDNKL